MPVLRRVTDQGRLTSPQPRQAQGACLPYLDDDMDSPPKPPDAIAANLLNVMTPEELAEQRRLVTFYCAPWPMGPVEIRRADRTNDRKDDK
jgi:hypothetical protein